MKEEFYSFISLIESLIFITVASVILFLVVAYSDYRTRYPIYSNIDCIVTGTGIYSSELAPKSYIVVKIIGDSTNEATLNSANIDNFIDFKYKIGDTLHYKYLLKQRFKTLNQTK